jgi:hypothetical protein
VENSGGLGVRVQDLLNFDLFLKIKRCTESTICRPREGGRSTGPPWTSQWPAAGVHWGLTSGGGAARRASGGREQSSAAMLGVRGVRGEEVKRGERG